MMYIPTVRMVRLDKYTSIRDIVHWEINIPKSDVSFLYTRKPDGFTYFRCSDQYEYNRRVFMSSDELLCVCQHAEEWVNEHFKSHCVLNRWEIVISGGGDHDDKKLTLTFSKYLDTNIMDIRIWQRREDTGLFNPTIYGFYIRGTSQIKYMGRVREKMLKQLRKTEMLTDYVTAAHYMLYEAYYTFKKLLPKDSENIINQFLASIDVHTFIRQLEESLYVNDPDPKHMVVSGRELASYVLWDGVEELKKYIISNNEDNWHLCKDLDRLNLNDVS